MIMQDVTNTFKIRIGKLNITFTKLVSSCIHVHICKGKGLHKEKVKVQKMGVYS